MQRFTEGFKALWGRMAVLVFLGLLAPGLSEAARAQSFAYVTLRDGTLAVIDTANNEVVDRIEIGAILRGVAFTPDGEYAFVIGEVDYVGHVWVVDTDTRTIMADIMIASQPMGIAFTPDGAFAYVTSYSFGTVSIIDTAKKEVIDTVEVRSANGVAITPDGAFALVCMPGGKGAGTLIVIDTKTHAIVDRIFPGFRDCQQVAITPDGAFAYVLSPITTSVIVIDLAARMAVRETTLTAPRPQALLISSGYAFVSSETFNAIEIIDTTTHLRTDTLNLNHPWNLAFTPDGEHMYVTQPGLDMITVLDAATFEILNRIALAPGPRAIAMAP